MSGRTEMKIEYSFKTVGYSTSEELGPNEVFVAVGNTFEGRIFHRSGPDDERSTAVRFLEAVRSHPEGIYKSLISLLSGNVNYLFT